MSKTKSEIINVADDFGISRTANRNILKLVSNQKVDRVSVLIDHHPDNLRKKEIKALLDSGTQIDLHLDYQVSAFKKKKRRLREGTIGRLLSFGVGYLIGKGRTSCVERAWEKQIQKFIKLFGRKPDGINSHQYIHLFPSYFKIVLKLARKYDITYIRYGSQGVIRSRHNVSRILGCLHKLTIGQFNDNACRSSDYLVSLDWIRNINRFLRNKPQGTIEIVSHPEREEEFRSVMKYF